MNASVQQAIAEIRSAFPSHPVEAESDEHEGVFVKVHNLHLGDQYEPSQSWVAFRITFQYPHADVYPHFCVVGLKRKDGKPLGIEFQSNKEWQTPTKLTPARSEAATMISRRSNKLNPATDTAAFKLQKVLDWIRSK
jgi:hypothetical protein